MKLKEKFFSGHALYRYKIPQKYIRELNSHYNKIKKKLLSYGPRLAGRLDSELDIINSLQGLMIFPSLTKAMDHYINESIKCHLMQPGHYDLQIEACWINDMVAGEYNPPHTHNDAVGFSTVLFLKVPEFINDAKNPHKFKDGKIVFIGVDGIECSWHTPYVGDLYIFKASHQHAVMPFKTETPNEIRRSMSFNFVAVKK